MTTMNTNKLKAGAVSLLLATSMIASATAVSFKDVPETHWAYPSITKLSDIGVINGVGNGLYAPDRTLTNAEFCKMIATRFYGFKVNQASLDMYVQYGSAYGTPWYDQFLDELGVFGWDESCLFEASADLDGEHPTTLGILTGTNVRASYRETGKEMLNPNDTITRYDMAQIIYNMLIERGAKEIEDPETFETLGWTRPELEKLSDTSVVADWDSIPANYRDAVSTCYALGYLTGVDDAGTFAGNQGVTRAAAATIIDRMVQPNHVEIPEGAYRVKPGDPIITEMDYVTVEGENLHVMVDGIIDKRGGITIATRGKYSTIVFTVTASGSRQSISIGHGDTYTNNLISRHGFDSYETRTVKEDISGRNIISIGYSVADLTITDIYLY